MFQLPYIFRDYDHVFKALDGSDTITKYYDGVLDKHGLKLIGFIAAGYRGIYGHGAINSLADVKGKKVRVQEDKILVATFKALGMISTPIAFPEVATALQTRVIDFAEGGVNTFYHNKFYDIVKYVADVRHTHQAIALIMSKAGWQKQDAAGQKAIMDAWAHARAFNRKFILDEDKSIQDQVQAKGVTITKPDATPFRQATQSVYEEFYATPAGKDAKQDGRLHPGRQVARMASRSERRRRRSAGARRACGPRLRRARPCRRADPRDHGRRRVPAGGPALPGADGHRRARGGAALSVRLAGHDRRGLGHAARPAHRARLFHQPARPARPRPGAGADQCRRHRPLRST